MSEPKNEESLFVQELKENGLYFPDVLRLSDEELENMGFIKTISGFYAKMGNGAVLYFKPKGVSRDGQNHWELRFPEIQIKDEAWLSSLIRTNGGVIPAADLLNKGLELTGTEEIRNFRSLGK